MKDYGITAVLLLIIALMTWILFSGCHSTQWPWPWRSSPNPDPLIYTNQPNINP